MAGGVTGKRYHRGLVGETLYKGVSALILPPPVVVPVVSGPIVKRSAQNVAQPGVPVPPPPLPVLKPTTVLHQPSPKTALVPSPEHFLTPPTQTARKWLPHPS